MKALIGYSAEHSLERATSLVKRFVSFRLESGREIGSTRWGGTPVTVGHRTGRNLLERKKRKAVIRNQPLPVSTLLLGTVVQFCLW